MLFWMIWFVYWGGRTFSNFVIRIQFWEKEKREFWQFFRVLSLEETIFLIGFFSYLLFIFNFFCFFSLLLSLKKFLWVEISKILGGLDGLGIASKPGFGGRGELFLASCFNTSSSFFFVLLLLRLRRSCGQSR